MSSEQEARRKFLQGILPVVLSAYLETQRVVSPNGIVTRALDQHARGSSSGEEEMRAMLARVKNLHATFEDGMLAVQLDKKTILGLVEGHLRKFFARDEAGTTAKFAYDLVSKYEDLDGELRLPTRSIFVKFVPRGTAVSECANSHLERARGMNPSELWLLTPTEERVEFAFDPVFRENGIIRGGLRTLGLTDLFKELVGNDYEITATQDDRGYKFLIGRKGAFPKRATGQ